MRGPKHTFPYNSGFRFGGWNKDPADDHLYDGYHYDDYLDDDLLYEYPLCGGRFCSGPPHHDYLGPADARGQSIPPNPFIARDPIVQPQKHGAGSVDHALSQRELEFQNRELQFQRRELEILRKEIALQKKEIEQRKKNS
ncbi:hypothetical protein P154DRAFT_579909 [Amniculicola lignicola CBS 123094]|uniref:Uncharacterized protein n=1 Tax=Amniculicola lignicola CBS 123094 TaxID=1392246 RepID=A0A6A5W3N6_9PLEO|nr:hypothetical protein P154DRAFT_579909 [Amniculicola lignicola CBS 123094]